MSVASREEAGERLNQGGVWAICLDRSDLERTRADARWLRRRRNPLPVFAVVEAAEIGRAVQLLTEGIEEIGTRGDETYARVVARLRALNDRGPEGGELPGFARVVAESPAALVVIAVALAAPAAAPAATPAAVLATWM